MAQKSLQTEFRFHAVAAVYTAVAALVAFEWPQLLLIQPELTPLSAAVGAGRILAIAGAVDVASAAWGAGLAYIARKRSWEARTCELAGNLPGLVGVGLFLFGLLFDNTRFLSPHFSTTLTVLIFSGFYSGNLCRRLTFPDGPDRSFLASLSVPKEL